MFHANNLPAELTKNEQITSSLNERGQILTVNNQLSQQLINLTSLRESIYLIQYWVFIS
jgi:hypothetical protein